MNSRQPDATTRRPGRPGKAGLILLGYLAAFGLAFAAVAVRLALTRTPEAQAASGMSAAGDLFLFLGVFGAASLVPTAGLFFLLRSFRRFWQWLSAGALLFAGTGLGAMVVCILVTRGPFGHSHPIVTFLGILRSLGSPLALVVLGVAAVAAPDRSNRRRMLLAAAIELPGFLYALAHWYLTMFAR